MRKRNQNLTNRSQGVSCDYQSLSMANPVGDVSGCELCEAHHRIGNSFDHTEKRCRDAKHCQKPWQDHTRRFVGKIPKRAGEPRPNDRAVGPITICFPR